MYKIFSMNKILTLFLILIGYISFSQNNTSQSVKRCVSPILNDAYEAWLENYLIKKNQFANSNKTTVIYNIPVIFHVIHNGESVGTGRNISASQVNSQLTILNQDFRKTNSDLNTWVTQSSFFNVAADCEITFSPALVDTNGNVLSEPGINRINRNSMGWSGPNYSGLSEPGGYIDNTIKTNSFWNPNNYMNIWVLEMNDNVLGYAQFPEVPVANDTLNDLISMSGPAETDGIVLDYRIVGNNTSATFPQYNLGRTATHEIGHWLGLRHINGDASCGNDYCGDTPQQSVLSLGCPAVTGNTLAANCGTNSPNPPGKMYQNYMDYSDDRCLVMFTKDQKTRMQSCLESCVRRHSLTTSAVGVKEHKPLNYFSIYPNPTKSNFEILTSASMNDVELLITNSIGELVYEEKKIKVNYGKAIVDVSYLKNGIYFLTIHSGISTETKKIIINN